MKTIASAVFRFVVCIDGLAVGYRTIDSLPALDVKYQIVTRWN